jgi:predicted anti-sigma-YlaC factor YlaD
MRENIHARAQGLLAESLIEGISPASQSWLEQHLQTCDDCARQAETTGGLLRALRSVAVAVPADLATRTQLRVRLRAQEAVQASRSSLVLWLLTGMSWLLGIFSAPLIWRGFGWLGTEFGLPKLALEFGFVLWWAVPALIAVGIVLHQRASASPGRTQL